MGKRKSGVGPVASQYGRAAAAARNAKLQQSKKSKKSKKSANTAIARPWTTPQFDELAKEERDIVLARIEKEIVQTLLLAPATAVDSNDSAAADLVKTLQPPRGGSAVQRYIVRGVNHVARLVARREARVVVFATNPESLVFAHVPLLCRLHKVPICVLHLSSKAFGHVFGLASLSVFAIRSLKVKTDANATATTAALTKLERTQLESIAAFLASKASKKNNVLP